MEDANNEADLDTNYQSEVSMSMSMSVSEKRRREGKSRSKVWQHFTKIIKEDGGCDKCQCNHCHKLFTCSSRSGTTHLLRHVTDGICPAFKKEKEKMVTVSSYPHPRNSFLPWKFDHQGGGGGGGFGQSSSMDVEVELLSSSSERIPADVESQPPPMPMKTMEEAEAEDYRGPTPPPPPSLPSSRGGKLVHPLHKLLPQPQPKGEAWMNEFRMCVAKLVELANGKVPVLSAASGDYSISAALKCLNEMEDIPQSSEMYLDAFEILQDGGERECFVCLPPEPRRRWLQRMLHRRHPLRYGSNI
ncbi:uncharacterized protein LOC127254967 [Andrographis paniculata]|uniref:uncharacterized protein LOC127254967 n=1 Tax=Andrographis paniculata TaxID=175694 RepID=UPI0021E957B2|nr:uncharacterized protein LOC127254967 [Andrographis paniculata]XP_051136299.1 uncharacterized protein LOC127254967 [Andrographis paniculata]XP_051136301.1 uncharacterized protein LOC127254967 [Andrographis paniculata]XP_051136302.1 uncharacterized protein LOC127254967 [Andrographis paniculata]XP_051136303.1 uncharacterized protein LOC127254967 [Andrographis paniculata]XP_051136304.1 uncharacterized protein LOC127254967 [Andrographis paniculata]XP_051136305.1 uncharacterized protein LOC12725